MTEAMRDAEHYLRRLNAIRELPTMPVVLVRLNGMLQDEDVSTEKLGSLIEADQAISSKILKLVNSAFYGFRSSVSSISHALMILGFNTVRNAAISVAVIDAVRMKERREDFDLTEFWQHSIAVAVAARYLARKIQMKDPDNAFTSGLLHDIGKLVMLQFLPELFDGAWRAARRDGMSFHEAEEKHLPIDHARIGAHLAQMWKFPAALVESIKYHHEPPILVEDAKLLVSLHLADLTVNHERSGAASNARVACAYPEHEAFARNHIETMPEWFATIENEIEEACNFFLDGRT
jgi:putative nucleotidyltransferase with HDIG domain